MISGFNTVNIHFFTGDIVMRSVLFVCEHNSARSQIAEAYLNRLAADKLMAASAGLEPGTLNSVVVEVLREDGIEIAGKQTQSVFALYKAGKQYDAVITVCSAEVGARCPIFPGRVLRRHWSFADPSRFQGSPEDIRQQTRIIRDKIKQKVAELIGEYDRLGMKLFMPPAA